ncbi:TatD family hydrolase [Riemerella columbina]|uniref:TatD family hydrolase n=1 Tax=Riemerella columbina TaxID=103810 RepID=UPI0026701B90|nr:TatD family hydrolase [Riemerella columbina]WKS95419.1 TatD family hydrolase [Riemerella columbina]
MMFNAHHHDLGALGIYNLPLRTEVLPSYYSIGLHPAKVTTDYAKALPQLLELAEFPECVAIGECGLDGLVEVPEALQEEAFKAQIAIAEQLQKPLIIHCVKRYYEVAKLCENLKVPVVFHGFNKNETIAEMLLEKGYYLSFGKALLNTETLQETFKKTPIERLFLETDAAKVDLSEIYYTAATLKQMSVTGLERQILANVNTVFNLNL